MCVIRQDETDDSGTPTAGGSTSTSRDSSPSRPVQKNRRRCFSCKARLELAFMEIGRCKCGKNNTPRDYCRIKNHEASINLEIGQSIATSRTTIATTVL